MDKYKISIWEDIDNGSTLLEQKVAEIGSNTMTAQHRALDPVLTENANGTHTLTFRMYYRYIDTVTGEEVDNPFISLMVNERKVKLFWKDKWYDFVIKDVTKDSSTKTLNFSCQDLYINELSKNGFNLEFDTELENNMGTIDELAEKVLTGTDWNLGQCDTLVQYQEEPLYEVHYNSAFTATPDRGGAQVTIPANANIYVFHSCYNTSKIQFLYGTTNLSTVEGSNVIIDKYQSDDSNWDCYTAEVTPNTGNLTQYRGRRVVENVKQVYDSRLKKYVDVYTLGTEKVYIDRTSKIETPQTISNLILNAEHFTTVAGWHVLDQEFIGTSTSGTATCTPVIVQQYYPTYSTVSTEYEGDGYLRVVLSPSNSSYEGPYTTTASVTIFNDAFNGNIVRLPREGIQNGQRYVLRTEVYTDDSGKPSTTKVTNFFSGSVYKNFGSSSATEITNAFVEDTSTSLSGAAVWTANTSFSIEEIDNNIISLQFKMPQTSWVKKVEFFPYVESGETYIEPNNFVTEAVVREIYNVYSPSEAEKDPLERTYIGQYEGAIPSNFEPTYEDEKVRFINVKESNRFNLLQTLAETFNCWAIFSIDHDETGAIIPNSKTVTFKERLGEDTGLGFVYGIDLRTVSRNLNSINIVTKTIVKQNANEFGEDGFCTIARAPENYSKENFILDFTYFVNQGLLDGNKINRDLYNSTDALFVEDEGGYFYLLNNYNTEYDETIEDLTFSKQILTQYESLLTVKQEQVKALTQQIESQRNRLCQIMGVTTWDSIDWTKQDIADYSTFMNGAAAESIMSAQKADVEGEITNLQAYVDELKTHIDELEVTQKELVDKKNALNEAFFKKYGAYLQEGTWNSEDYYDDSRYYLDACDVASTSAEPQVSYNISVLRLQALEEFKAKVFHIGDTVFIEDPEFFGYEWIDGIKTPIRKKVIVNQIVSHLENPTQDAITIQNYKTDFEDLFQRITASTQSLQYSSGEYNRAAGLVSSTGGITGDALQTSLAANNNLVYQVLNNSITQDPTGITLIDLSNPNNRVKITANGLYISDDGGATWKNAIRGSGVATEYLSAGNITTNNIAIYDGEWPTFRWDKDGISAYRFDGNNKYYNTFVRYDQYGIYGIENGLDFAPVDEDDVWDNARFALTWNGFMLKSNNNGGYVSITSDEDIQVKGTGDTERVKIGRLGEFYTEVSQPTAENLPLYYEFNGTSYVKTEDTEIQEGKTYYVENSIYGIRIKDAAGNPVMETGSDGELWLKDTLSVGNGQSSTTKIGYNPVADTVILPNGDQFTAHRVIDSEGSDYHFRVYDNGYVDTNAIVVESTYVDGTIIAHNGYFGDENNANIRIDSDGLSVYAYDESAQESKPISRINNRGFEAFGAGLTIYETANFVNYVPTIDTVLIPNKDYYTSRTETIDGVSTIIYEKVSEPTLSNIGSYFEKVYEGENALLRYEDGSLYVKGNGEFTGAIYAKEGSIANIVIDEDGLKTNGVIISGKDGGSITAKAGTIGGFTIGEKSLTSLDENLQLISSPNGIIKVGNAITLTNGVGTFGSIEINGISSTIKGDSYTITPDTSIFNNIIATGEIRTAVYANDTIQAVGSQMIFRPTYKIRVNDDGIDTTNNTISFVDEDGTLKQSVEGHYFYIVLNSGKKHQCTISKDKNSTEEQIVYIATLINGESIGADEQEIEDYKYIIDLGEPNNSLNIGINSSDTDGLDLIGEGITFNTFRVNSGSIIYEDDPKLFLGNLNNVNSLSSIKTDNPNFGLYSNNAFLKGSLVTKYSDNELIKYAGVNTFGAAPFTWGGTNNKPDTLASDGSPIIFWAGSAGIAPENVQGSPFQVTSDGTLYARQAYIVGSIITNSKIESAELWTAKIRGYSLEQENDTALEIYSGDSLIRFFNNYANSDEIFAIKTDGFYKDETPFIKLNSTPEFHSGEYYISTTGFKKENSNFYFKLENNEAQITDLNNKSQFIISSTNQGQMEIREINNIVYKNNYKYVYNQNTKGYDLYIS